MIESSGIFFLPVLSLTGVPGGSGSCVDKCIGERDRNRERQASDEERIWETVDMCVAEETQEEK